DGAGAAFHRMHPEALDAGTNNEETFALVRCDVDGCAELARYVADEHALGDLEVGRCERDGGVVVNRRGLFDRFLRRGLELAFLGRRFGCRLGSRYCRFSGLRERQRGHCRYQQRGEKDLHTTCLRGFNFTGVQTTPALLAAASSRSGVPSPTPASNSGSLPDPPTCLRS